MFVILLSSVALALEDPVKEDSERFIITIIVITITLVKVDIFQILFLLRNQKLGLLDYGFTAIFAIECMLKMLDLGMFLHPGSYMRSTICSLNTSCRFNLMKFKHFCRRDVWNVMDISVVSCAILSFYFK